MADLTPWRRRLLAALCGLGLAAGAAPFSIIWFLFLAVPFLGTLLMAQTSWRAGFGIGWWAGVTYFGGSMYWIVEPFFVDAARHAWMAPFALIFVATGMALFWGIAFALSTRFAGRMRVAAMVAWWVLAEFVRAFIFTGFPWGMLSYGWSKTPIFQSLSVLGPHGLTLLTLLIAALPVLMNRRLGVGLTLACLAALWVGGLQRMQDVAVTETVVRLVQPNAPQHLKWDPEWVRVFYGRAIEYTRAEDPPDVVVWPETSVPFLWEDAPNGREQMIRAARGAHLIAGHRKFQDLAVKNSLLHVSPDGQLVADYDKHHLVPFGEYIPLGELAAKIGIYGLAANDGMGFAAGNGPKMISVEGLPAYIPLICYEAIFPGYSQMKEGRPAWLLHITNDAWFGNFAGPYQHLVQARARAVEQGLPMARAANTGISAMLDPYGRITAFAELGQEGYVDAPLPDPLPPTPYHRFGELPWLIAVAALLIILSIRRRAAR